MSDRKILGVTMSWEGHGGIKDTLGAASLILVVLFILAGVVYGIGQDARDQAQWDNGDCGYYENYRINAMPARCVKEFAP